MRIYPYNSEGQPQIFLSNELRGPNRLFVAFHELAHHWPHPPRIQFFRGWEEAGETEANVVALCAMIQQAYGRPLLALKNGRRCQRS